MLLWWFRFISKIWISFLVPFLPFCQSEIETDNKGFTLWFSLSLTFLSYETTTYVKSYKAANISRGLLQILQITNTFFLLFAWLQTWLYCYVRNYSGHRQEADILPEKPFKDAKLIYVFFQKSKTHFLELTFPLGNLWSIDYWHKVL